MVVLTCPKPTSQTGWGTRAGIGDASAATAAADKLNAEEEEEKNRQHKANDRRYGGVDNDDNYGRYSRYNSNEDNIIAERRMKNKSGYDVGDDDRYKRVGTRLDPSAAPSLGVGYPSSSNIGLEYAASSTSHLESSVYVKVDDESPPSTSSPSAQFFMAPSPAGEGKTTAANSNPYSSFGKDKQRGGEWRKLPATPGGPRSRPVGRQGGSQQTGRRVIEEWV